MASTLARFESSGFLPVRTPKSLVYAAPVDNEEALHHPIVDASKTVRIYPGIFERMRRSMMKLVEACIESHGDILSTYYKCTLSAITHKLNVSGLMLIWTFFLRLVCGIGAQNLSAPFSYNLYMREIFSKCCSFLFQGRCTSVHCTPCLSLIWEVSFSLLNFFSSIISHPSCMTRSENYLDTYFTCFKSQWRK
jgi:hypothetical protein